MIHFFKQLFKSGSGISMMRFMSFVSLWAGITIAFYGMSKFPVDYSGISLLVSIFLSAAFGGKVMQKRIEADGTKDETEVSTRSETVTTSSTIKPESNKSDNKPKGHKQKVDCPD